MSPIRGTIIGLCIGLLIAGSIAWAIGEGGIQPGVSVHELVVVLDNSAAPTAQQLRRPGTINLVDGAGTTLLPAGEVGMSICVKDDDGAADDLIVDVPGTDTIVLTGVVQAAGTGITNAGGASLGDYVCLYALKANEWHVMGKQGTWASQ